MSIDIPSAISFVRLNHRAILSTIRSDGKPQSSPVAATVDSEEKIVISTRENAIKTLNIRRDPFASVVVFTDEFFGPWVQIEGETEVVSLPAALEGLVDYYRSISGEHPDWEEYRAAMVTEERVLLRITPSRVGPNKAG